MISNNIDGQPTQSTVYSWKSGTANAAGAVAATNITTITAFEDLFTPFTFASSPTRKRLPTKISVESDGAAYIKINGGDVITIGATDPFEAEDLVIESIGISTGAADRTVTVYLQ